MDHLGYMFAGFAVFWAGLFVYIVWLQVRLRTVTRELERLEERIAEFTANDHAEAARMNPPVTARRLDPPAASSAQRTAE